MSNYPRLLNAQEMQAVITQLLPKIPENQRNSYLTAVSMLRQANDIRKLDSDTFEAFTVNNVQQALFKLIRRRLSILAAYGEGSFDKKRGRALYEALSARIISPLEQALQNGSNPYPLTVDLRDI